MNITKIVLTITIGVAVSVLANIIYKVWETRYNSRHNIVK